MDEKRRRPNRIREYLENSTVMTRWLADPVLAEGLYQLADACMRELERRGSPSPSLFPPAAAALDEGAVLSLRTDAVSSAWR